MGEKAARGLKFCIAMVLCMGGVLSFQALSYLELPTLRPEWIEQITQRFGESAPRRLQRWHTFVEQSFLSRIQRSQLISSQDTANFVKQHLEEVNEFVNYSLDFVQDILHWNRVDYWATPNEAIASAAGDCEDFSIAKYYTLRATGVSYQKMRMVYVRANVNGYVEPHMVLAYYQTIEADPLILDNLRSQVLPARMRPDLIPVYSFNEEEVWAVTLRGEQRWGSPGKIRQWEAMQQRWRNETQL